MACHSSAKSLTDLCPRLTLPHVPAAGEHGPGSRVRRRRRRSGRLGDAAGVGSLEFRTAPEANRLEPALRCAGALHIPVTGIVDAAALVRALQADTEAAGGKILLRTPFRAARASGAFEIDAGVGAQAIQ